MDEDDRRVKFVLYNPQGGATLGERSKMDVYIYDAELIDYRYSYALLNGAYNDAIAHQLIIGHEANVTVVGYMGKDTPRNDDSEYFFLKVVNKYGKIISHKAFNTELLYTLEDSSVYEFIVYASAKGCITMTFYDNQERVPPMYLTRLSTAFPETFTEDTEMQQMSALFETVFIIPEDGNYTFYVT